MELVLVFMHLHTYTLIDIHCFQKLLFDESGYVLSENFLGERVMSIVIFVEYLLAFTLFELFFGPSCYFGHLRIGLFGTLADFEAILWVYMFLSAAILLFMRIDRLCGKGDGGFNCLLWFCIEIYSFLHLFIFFSYVLLMKARLRRLLLYRRRRMR